MLSRLRRFRTKPEESIKSVKAVNGSMNDLNKIKDREHKVEKVARDMARIKARNHFADQLYKVIGRAEG